MDKCLFVDSFYLGWSHDKKAKTGRATIEHRCGINGRALGKPVNGEFEICKNCAFYDPEGDWKKGDKE